MTQEEIIEGNKLIAEFMGGKSYKGSNYIFYSFINGNIKPYSEFLDEFKWGYGCPLDYELKFHSSWDWLMPVVEKIYMLDEVKDVAVHYDYTRIWLQKGFIESNSYTYNSFIEECWLTIVEFIKWYNEQKEK